MKISLGELPPYIKLEISKEDLLEFAEQLKAAAPPAADSQTQEPEDELLNFEEMRAFLGIAKSTGYQRISRGEIPHFKKGRRLYFRKSELMRWVESGRRKTKLDLEVAADRYLLRSKRKVI